MKRIFLMFCVIYLGINITAQNLATYAESIIFGKDLIGKSITIVDAYNESEMFYAEKPDTVWIKRVRKPKLDKHYTLFYTYKGVKDKYGYYYTPSEAVIGRTFFIEDVVFNEREQEIDAKFKENKYNVYTLKLRDILSNEIIYMKLEKNEEYNILELKIRDTEICNDLKGKIFVDSFSGIESVVKDCFYECKSTSYGWSIKSFNDRLFGYNYFIVEFESGRKINSRNAKEYITQIEYKEKKKKEEFERMEKEAKQGEYKMILSSLIKPKSSKFTKGALSTEGNITLYMDNYVLLSIGCEEEYFGFSLKNLSQETIKINWDNIVFIDEYSQSRNMIHSGIKYIDANKPQKPSLIAKNSTLHDMLVPTHRLHFSDYSYEWSVLAILNYINNYGYYDKGTQVQLIIPIEINGISYEYTLKYDVIWYWKNPEIREKWLKLKRELELQE